MHMWSSPALPRELPPLVPQTVAAQGTETSTAPRGVKVCGRMLRSLLRVKVACRNPENLHKMVEDWRVSNEVTPAELEKVWRNGGLTTTGQLRHTRWLLGEDKWFKRGRGLLEISAALAKGQCISVRAAGEEYGIPGGSMHRYINEDRLTEFGQEWVEEVKKLLNTQESAQLSENQNPAREVLRTAAAEVSAMDDGHRTTPSPLQFPEPLRRESNLAWGHLPSVRYAPAQPLLSSDARMLGDD